MIYLGKYTDKTYKNKIEAYDNVHLDMLWYLMNLTGIERFVDAISFREFLIRLFLIRQKKVEEYALNIIDDELIIDGFINDKYFCLKINDLINLIGFAKSSAKYNIQGTLNEFIATYEFELPNLKFVVVEGKEKPTYKISQQVMLYSLIGVTNLIGLESCTIKFHENIKNIDVSDFEGKIKLADFIMNRLPIDIFSQYDKDFPEVRSTCTDRYLKDQLIQFDIYKDMDQENLALIYEIIIDKDTADRFRELGNDEDLKFELQWFNEMIIFAYGVKHKFIRLSDYYNSLFTEVDPQFLLEIENIFGEDNETYSTNYYYTVLEMSKWEHLLP